MKFVDKFLYSYFLIDLLTLTFLYSNGFDAILKNNGLVIANANARQTIIIPSTTPSIGNVLTLNSFGLKPLYPPITN